MFENKIINEPSEPAIQISRGSFDRLADFITRELGIKMPESKVSLVQSRLLRRVRELGLNSLDAYCEYFFNSNNAESERAHLINAITTNKTDFFREPQHFRFMTEKALPELDGWAGFSEGRSRCNVWSVPCSSGEEPYTLAMLLSEYALARPRFNFQILATDVSTRVLQMAKDGIYSRPLIDPVPSELRRKYLLNGKGEQSSLVRVKPALRQHVSFHQLNLMDADYSVREMFHIIFCRNVLIYFDRATQQSVINKLCRHLHPGGYLFVSHSESLTGLDLPLVPLGASCFRKPGRD